tara:strand:+ start:82 stop:501 length:420 start_codon:yes stop_codon:yes gene_type:complete
MRKQFKHLGFNDMGKTTTNKKSNELYTVLYDVPERIYKESIWINNMSLKDITGLDISLCGDMETIRFFRLYDDKQTQAISFNIPYFDKKHPEKLIANKYSIFGVFEYVRQKEHTTREIDFLLLKDKFDECLLKICRHCI